MIVPQGTRTRWTHAHTYTHSIVYILNQHTAGWSNLPDACNRDIRGGWITPGIKTVLLTRQTTWCPGS